MILRSYLAWLLAFIGLAFDINQAYSADLCAMSDTQMEAYLHQSLGPIVGGATIKTMVSDIRNACTTGGGRDGQDCEEHTCVGVVMICTKGKWSAAGNKCATHGSPSICGGCIGGTF